MGCRDGGGSGGRGGGWWGVKEVDGADGVGEVIHFK